MSFASMRSIMLARGSTAARWSAFFLLPILSFLSGCPSKSPTTNEPSSGTPMAGPTAGPVAAAPLDAKALSDRLKTNVGPVIETMRVSGNCVVEAPDLDGKAIFGLSLLSMQPDYIRFRASREPVGELFQLAQHGSVMTVFFPRERQYYHGEVLDLDQSTGLLKQIQPTSMVRGITADTQLLTNADALQWSRLDASTLQADGPCDFPDLPFARYVLRESDMTMLRVYLFAENPDDAQETADRRPEIAVVYTGWTTVDGARLPTGAVLSIPRRDTRMTLTDMDYLVNPPIRVETFAIPVPKGLELIPLRDLRFELPKEEAAPADAATP